MRLLFVECLALVALDPRKEAIADSRHPRTMGYWTRTLRRCSSLPVPWLVEQRLVERGVLGRDHHLRLVLLQPRWWRRSSLRSLQELFRQGPVVDPWTALMTSLLLGCGLLSRFVAREQLKAARRRTREIADADLVGRAFPVQLSEITFAEIMKD